MPRPMVNLLFDILCALFIETKTTSKPVVNCFQEMVQGRRTVGDEDGQASTSDQWLQQEYGWCGQVGPDVSYVQRPDQVQELVEDFVLPYDRPSCGKQLYPRQPLPPTTSWPSCSSPTIPLLSDSVPWRTLKQLAGITDDDHVPLYRPDRQPHPQRDYEGSHMPIPEESRKNCRLCWLLEKTERKTYWRCSGEACGEFGRSGVYLCMDMHRNCFVRWHAANMDGRRK